MTAHTLTLTQLRKLKPCRERMDALADSLPKRKRITAAEAREYGATFNDLVWVSSALARNDKDIERRLRMWMADCAARVLYIFERDRPKDNRPRKAIEAARLYANGEIDDAAWDAARAAAWDAARAAARDAAWAAARDAAWDAARDAAWDAARAAAWDAARAAAWDAARDAAWDAEEEWQFTRLVEWLSDSEPKPLDLATEAEVST